MEIALDIARLVFGCLVLYLGAEWLVKGSAGLARSFGVKPLIVGLTVVAYGTSAPELAVSVSANLGGSSPLALGNIIGSNIANLALILGIVALIAPPRVDGSLMRRELPILVGTAIAVPLVLLDGTLSFVEALILFAISVAFTVATLVLGDRGDSATPAEAEATAEAAGAPGGDGKGRLAIITFVGLALLIGGGHVFVEGARGLALTMGVSDRIVGLTVVAIGTSLPELAASVVAALRGHSALAIGNVVGSNIFNVFAVLGLTGLVGPLEGDLSALGTDIGFLAGVTLLGCVFMRTDRRISRGEGVVLLGTYVAFVVIAAVGW